jgi:hypothetical protein
MSKTLDDAYKALSWIGNYTRPVYPEDYEKSYQMEKDVKAALDALKIREQNDEHPEP